MINDIRINKAITEHWLWQDARYLQWWVDLLFMASEETETRLINKQLVTLQRGQLFGGVRYLTERWGCSHHTTSKFLHSLEDEDMIVPHQLPHQISVITICNFESYAVSESDHCHTNCHTNCHTTKKEMPLKEKNNIYKKEKKQINKFICVKKEKKEQPQVVVSKTEITTTPIQDKEQCLLVRQQAFAETIKPYVDTAYPRQMCIDFYYYWTEPNKSKTKMRFEQERTWEIGRRLSYWQRRSRQINGNNNTSTSESRADEVARFMAELARNNRVQG